MFFFGGMVVATDPKSVFFKCWFKPSERQMLNCLFFNFLIDDFFLNKNLLNYNCYLFIKNNFYDYSSDQYLLTELLPEIFIIIFIFYSLINIFNDKKIPNFQYYK